MTRMLATVSTLAEAEVAVAGGADIVDLKDPADGVLGAPARDAIRAMVDAVGRRRPVSAWAGEPGMQPDLVTASVREIAATGADYIQVGIFPGGDAAGCIAELASLASRVKLLGVFFADAAPDLSLLPLLGRSGFAGAVIDTRTGSGLRLLDYVSIPGLLGFVDRCHAAGLAAGLAGALETPDIPRLLVLSPDLLGFREALRGPNGRSDTLDPVRVRTVRGLIPPEQPVRAMRDDDFPAMPGRMAAAAGDMPVDLVFVRDLVLPVFIGAYSREREAPQKVRFAVTASVLRTKRVAEDMRDVFSYDLITDGIRMLTGSGHIALIETLAERIATMVLGHKRVTKVVVRVEKLETGSGTVGVEIERARTAAEVRLPSAVGLGDTSTGGGATS